MLVGKLLHLAKVSVQLQDRQTTVAAGEGSIMVARLFLFLRGVTDLVFI